EYLGGGAVSRCEHDVACLRLLLHAGAAVDRREEPTALAGKLNAHTRRRLIGAHILVQSLLIERDRRRILLQGQRLAADHLPMTLFVQPGLDRAVLVLLAFIRRPLLDDIDEARHRHIPAYL